jgi:hypothetical protein
VNIPEKGCRELESFSTPEIPTLHDRVESEIVKVLPRHGKWTYQKKGAKSFNLSVYLKFLLSLHISPLLSSKSPKQSIISLSKTEEL